MSNSAVVQDDKGTSWVVRPGDPAYIKVRKLHNLGYRFIVLPRGYLARGKMPSEEWMQRRLNMVQLPGTDREIALRWGTMVSCIRASAI